MAIATRARISTSAFANEMTPNRRLLLLASLAVLIGAVSFAAFEPIVAVISCVLGWAMLAIAAIDAEQFIIPDVLSLPAIPLGLLVTRGMSGDPSLAGEAVLTNLGAAAFGALALLGIREFYRRWRGREGLGLGDVKLAAAAGAWTGFEGLGHILLLSCVLAFAYVLVINARNLRAIQGSTALPFGVFLGPSIWLVWCANVLMLGSAGGF
jgi:leader peptidase (prepilin peptidase) / N-methyltransferase